MGRETVLRIIIVGFIWTYVSNPTPVAAQEDEVALLAKARLEAAVKGHESAATPQQM